MPRSIDSNISHSLYYTSVLFGKTEEFAGKVMQAFPGAVRYDITAEPDDPF